MTVFNTRLGLSLLKVIGFAEALATHRVVEDLRHRTTDAEVGYVACENLAHPPSHVETGGACSVGLPRE
ncbi:hypothetical protein ACIP4S_09595 [Streptomyces chartreusis]|uniref:hypothetical protein n=1 Tax=Streptomyces chartreusis TaxID=1969 RepID=UPI00381CEE8D